MKVRNVVISALLALWGAAVLLSAAIGSGGASVHSGTDYGTAYHAGSITALVVAVVMLIAGIRGLWLELSRRNEGAPGASVAPTPVSGPDDGHGARGWW